MTNRHRQQTINYNERVKTVTYFKHERICWAAEIKALCANKSSVDEQILDKDVQESPKPRTPTPIQTSYFRSSLPDLIAGSTGLRRKKVEPIKSGFMIESKRPKVFKAAKELGRSLGKEVGPVASRSRGYGFKSSWLSNVSP